MNSRLYRKLKYAGATLLILLLLSGADCEPLTPQCDFGPSGAYRTLAGTNASIVLVADNGTYGLTMQNPDPYLIWQHNSDLEDFGNHSVTCFMDGWNARYGDDEKRTSLVWLGTEEPIPAWISSLRYDGATITGKLERFDGYPALSGSGEIVIIINRSPSRFDSCRGADSWPSKNCFQPFLSFEDDTNIISIPGASLNFSSFANAVLPGSDFRGTALGYADFTGADLRDANFSSAVLVYTDFNGADMEDVTLGNARVYQAIAPNGATVNSVTEFKNNLEAGSTPATTTIDIPFPPFSR